MTRHSTEFGVIEKCIHLRRAVSSPVPKVLRHRRSIDNLSRIQVVPWVGPIEQGLEHRDPRRGDVLLKPLRVLGPDGVVMREGRAVVDERLLDR